MTEPRPLPTPTPLSQPFWDGTRQHRLRVQRCDACGELRFPPQVLCRACLGERYQWVDTSGRGTVHSLTVLHSPAGPAFAADVPYVVAVIELDEGPLLLSNVVGCAPDEVTIGAPVEVDFVDVTDEITLYPFRLAAGAP